MRFSKDMQIVKINLKLKLLLTFFELVDLLQVLLVCLDSLRQNTPENARMFAFCEFFAEKSHYLCPKLDKCGLVPTVSLFLAVLLDLMTPIRTDND